MGQFSPNCRVLRSLTPARTAAVSQVNGTFPGVFDLEAVLPVSNIHPGKDLSSAALSDLQDESALRMLHSAHVKWYLS